MTQFAGELVEAVRVRPNRTALRLLREHQETLGAVASTEHDRIEAAGLLLLIELAEKINAVFEKAT